MSVSLPPMSLPPDAIPALHVLAVVGEGEVRDLIERTVAREHPDDVVSFASDLSEGLSRSAAEAPDLVFIDVSLGRRAGLAVIHHLRAVSPAARVYALARPGDLELATQATALGGAGLLLLPLSGDEVLTAVSEVRTRLAERRQLELSEARRQDASRGIEIATRLAESASVGSRRAAAQAVERILADVVGPGRTAIYFTAGKGTRQLMRVTDNRSEGQPESPAFGEEMEVLTWSRQHGLGTVPLTLGAERYGLLVVTPHAHGADVLPEGDLVGATVALLTALVSEREKSLRGAMKDPESSAYTFAYFVDVAGREIDKARRHKRRFALATVSLDDDVSDDQVEVVERILAAVRDTDVLAKVDENEFYLLLPETGGTGAHSCRRRILRKLADLRASALGVRVGVATFPQDGRDLSRLLRVAKHRSDLTSPVVSRLLLTRDTSLPAVVDELRQEAGRADTELATVDLPQSEFIELATEAVRQALRSGAVTIVATHRAGLSVGAAIRAALGHDRQEARYRPVDVSRIAGSEDVEALTITAEHGAYAVLAVHAGDNVRGVHTVDATFADLINQRLGELSGLRLGE